jgi:hypothetical protein
MTDIVAEATRKWTPYQIELMLHYHVSAAPFIRWNAPAFGETVGDLTARPTKVGWYWVKLLGRISIVEIREYDLLFGERPGLRHVTAWQGPIEPEP